MALRRGIVRSFIGLTVAGGIVAALSGPAWALSETPDITWETNKILYASVQLGNTLFVGGGNTIVEPIGKPRYGFPVSGLAAFDITTGEGISTWTPEVTSTTGTPMVRSLALSPDGTWLYVGGNFDAIDGQPLRNLGRVSTATGEVDPTFAPEVGDSTSFVYALLAMGDRVYCGGTFVRISGTRRPKLAAIDTDGTLDPDWVPPVPDAKVDSLALASDGATIFVGGHFMGLGGVPRQSVARVTTDTGALDPWAIPTGTIVAPQTAWTLVATPTRLFGGFGSKGPNYLAAFHLDNGNTGNQVWRFGTVGNVQTIALSPSGTQLFFGGHFGLGRLQQNVCGNIPLKGLAVVDPVNGQIDCSWVPYIEPNNYQGPHSMVVNDTYLWIAGKFSTIEGVRHHDVARFTL